MWDLVWPMWVERRALCGQECPHSLGRGGKSEFGIWNLELGARVARWVGGCRMSDGWDRMTDDGWQMTGWAIRDMGGGIRAMGLGMRDLKLEGRMSEVGCWMMRVAACWGLGRLLEIWHFGIWNLSFGQRRNWGSLRLVLGG